MDMIWKKENFLLPSQVLAMFVIILKERGLLNGHVIVKNAEGKIYER